MLVEDDPTTRNALRAILGRKGFDVEAVSNLSDARPILESMPDYMILDMMLPDGDGISLLRSVRESNQPTRVIVTTGVVDSRRLADIHRLAPETLLLKPVELPKLLDALGFSH